MTSQIDFRTLPVNAPVLCIPRVFSNISESRIRGIFNGLNMGELERIDIVPIANGPGEKFNRVFVHFRRWNDSENSNKARDRLINGKEIKIIYDDPWFWKITAYRQSGRKSEPAEGPRRPTIEFDFDEDKPSHSRSNVRPQQQQPLKNGHGSIYGPQPSQVRSYVRPQQQTSTSGRGESGHRRREDTRGHRQEEQPVRNFNEPQTPASSPMKEMSLDDAPVQQEEENSSLIDASVQAPIDYGNILPQRRKRGIVGTVKKPTTATKATALNIEDGEIEDGEIEDGAK